MSNFFKERADELGLTPDDIAFELRSEHGTHYSANAVRAWFGGTVPALKLAEPLAAILKTTKAKVLGGMHEMAVARKEATAAK